MKTFSAIFLISFLVGITVIGLNPNIVSAQSSSGGSTGAGTNPLLDAPQTSGTTGTNPLLDAPQTSGTTGTNPLLDAPQTSGTTGTNPLFPPSGGASGQQSASVQAYEKTVGGGTSGILAEVMTFVMSLFAWLLGVAMVTLDDAVYYTVFTMGNYIHNLSAIGVAWRVLRDIGNMVLIFGFLAIGIGIILDTNFYGGGTKMIPTLLIVAIFLNFSLFISEAIIDVGNLFASEIFSEINDGQTPTSVSFSETSFQNEGISNKIMSQLGLQSLYGAALQTTVDANGTPSGSLFSGPNILLIGFLGCILFIVAAFVMFSLAFMLIARFVMLVFLIIVAPIGFAGLAVPKLGGTAKTWWNTLFRQTMTAPILLLLLYVALAVITDANFVTGLGSNISNNAWTGSLNAGEIGSFGSILLSFLVAMGLLLAVTRFASQMSAFGASAATKYAGALSFGAAAYTTSLGLNAFGRGGRFAVQNSPLKNTRVGRLATRAVFRPLENARGDIRNIPVTRTALKLGGASDAATKPIGNSALGRGTQALNLLKEDKKEKERYDKEIAIPPIKRISTETNIALQDGDYSKVTGILSSVSDTDLESESWTKELAKNPLAASLLPQTRFDKLQGSANLSPEQKADIAKARKEGNDPDNKDSRYNFDPNGFKYGPTLSNGSPHPHAGKTRGEVYLESLKTAKARGALTGDLLLKKQPPTAQFPYLPRQEVLSNLKAADFEAIRTKQKDDLDLEQREALGDYIENIISPTSVDPRKAEFMTVLASPQFKNYYTLK